MLSKQGASIFRSGWESDDVWLWVVSVAAPGLDLSKLTSFLQMSRGLAAVKIDLINSRQIMALGAVKVDLIPAIVQRLGTVKLDLINSRQITALG